MNLEPQDYIFLMDLIIQYKLLQSQVKRKTFHPKISTKEIHKIKKNT